jgi:hypothetical protein
MLSTGIWTISISAITKKITLVCSNAVNINYSASTVALTLGLPESGLSTFQTSFTGINIIQLMGLDYVVIKSYELVPFNHSMGLTNNTNNTLDTIAVVVPFGGSQTFENTTGHHAITHHHLRIIKQFDLQLLDYAGREIDFLGTNFRCSLKITYEN